MMAKKRPPIKKSKLLQKENVKPVEIPSEIKTYTTILKTETQKILNDNEKCHIIHLYDNCFRVNFRRFGVSEINKSFFVRVNESGIYYSNPQMLCPT